MINHGNMSSQQMSEYNHRGWFPCPKETEEHYLRRIELWNHFFSYPPKEIDHFLTDGEWEGARKRLTQLYDLVPEAIIAHYSNKDIGFLQGALMWEVPFKDLNVPLIQLKKKFQYKRLWGIYSLNEVLAHEAAHALRLGFKQDTFEEFFAYRTSNSLFRRFLGPLFQHLWEPYFFLGLMVVVFLPFFIASFSLTYPLVNKIGFLPGLYFLYLLARLVYYRIVLRLAARRLKSKMKEPGKVLGLMFRMTAHEIKLCALKSKKWDSYLQMEKIGTFRWRFLYTLYF